MDYSDGYYKIMCRLFDRMIYKRDFIDTLASTEELENRIKKIDYTPRDYLEAGLSIQQCRDIINDHGEKYKGWIDALGRFLYLIGIIKENEDEDISGN